MSADEPVSLSPYDPEWPRLFEHEATRLAHGLGETQLKIEHIGSTAVPGLLAKPIVDLMLGVTDLGHSQGLVDRLVSLGYEESGHVSARRYLRKRGERQFNIQIVEYRGPLWLANLALRDYLRSDSDAASRYAEAKRSAAEVAPMLLAYSDLKRGTIEELIRLAHQRMVALVEARTGTQRDDLRAEVSDYLVEFAELQGGSDVERSADGSPAYEWFDRYWVDDDRIPFLVSVSGEVAGFCLVRVMNGGWNIAEFGVGAAWRRRGVGRRAVEQLAAAGQRAGAAHLRADVDSWNQRALLFWTACGFQPTEEGTGRILTLLPLDFPD